MTRDASTSGSLSASAGYARRAASRAEGVANNARGEDRGDGPHVARPSAVPRPSERAASARDGDLDFATRERTGEYAPAVAFVA